MLLVSPPAKILVVDDDPGNLGALSRLLHVAYDVQTAQTGKRALELAVETPGPDLILLDLKMPGMDGHEVHRQLRDNPATRDIPVIFVTGEDSHEDEERALEEGAVDYVAKPYRSTVILARVRTQVDLKRSRDWLKNQNAYLEAEIARRMEDINLIQDITINALAELAETRDPETGNHIKRTQEYVRILAEYLRSNARFKDYLTDATVNLIAKSAPLHDIGKVGIPDNILLKPAKLDAEEWVVMKSHSVLGTLAIERAVRHADRSVKFLDIAKQIARFHHEKWDGSGYPEGLQGEQIPIPARLMALADVFDALISRRTYKEPLPIAQVCQIIEAERGHHFDPDIVDAFHACQEEFAFVAERYQ